MKVLLRGGGDLATGVAHRLFKSGFKVAIIELPEPRMVRRTVSFAEAVYTGSIIVEDVKAVRVKKNPESFSGYIPVMIDPEGESIKNFKPDVLVDCRMMKKNPDTKMTDAPLVVALGPGYTAGKDCHYVVETKRGHDLGKVITKGGAHPNTGIPGDIAGYSAERVLRSPGEGIFEASKEIGSIVKKDGSIGKVGEAPVISSLDGVIRGLLRNGLKVSKGEKLGDIDPRVDIDVNTISDKSRSIGGGVLEAILNFYFA